MTHFALTNTVVLFFTIIHTARSNIISNISPNQLNYIGRHKVNQSMARFDWVGTGIKIDLRGTTTTNTTLSIDMDSGCTNAFAVLLNQTIVATFIAKAGRKNYTLWTGHLSNSDVTTLQLIKTTEGDMKTATSIFGMDVRGASTVVQKTPPSQRLRIDVYGDSDSAAFGVDGNEDKHPLDCALCEGRAGCFENFLHGWVYTAATSTVLVDDADYRVQAVSGIGVVKNAGDGLFCFTDLVLGKLIHRTLGSVDSNDYNASSWVPHAVVVMIGGNDYGNIFPPSEKEFTNGYLTLVRDILASYGSSSKKTPLVVHVCNTSNAGDHCDYIKNVVKTLGKGNVYSDTGDQGQTPNGCNGHRNATQQKVLGNRVANVIIHSQNLQQ